MDKAGGTSASSSTRGASAARAALRRARAPANAQIRRWYECIGHPRRRGVRRRAMQETETTTVTTDASTEDVSVAPNQRARASNEAKTTVSFTSHHTFALAFDAPDPHLLRAWMKDPRHLLVASYGEENVREAPDSEGGPGGEGMLWRVRLPSVKVLAWSVVPTFDVLAVLEDGGVVFTSDHIELSGSAVPKSFMGMDFSLYSRLALTQSEYAEAPPQEQVISAENSLELGVDLPRRLARLPGVRATGNTIIRAILKAVDSSARKRLRKSFEDWTEAQEQGTDGKAKGKGKGEGEGE